MALTRIGLNVSNLNNITAPVIDIKNNTAEILTDIPNKANTVTQGWLGIITLAPLFLWMMWRLSQDQAQGGDFGYSQWRSFGISAGVCSIIGIYCLNLGFFTNYYHVALFIIATFITTGIVWKSQT